MELVAIPGGGARSSASYKDRSNPHTEATAVAAESTIVPWLRQVRGLDPRPGPPCLVLQDSLRTGQLIRSSRLPACKERWITAKAATTPPLKQQSPGQLWQTGWGTSAHLWHTISTSSGRWAACRPGGLKARYRGCALQRQRVFTDHATSRSAVAPQRYDPLFTRQSALDPSIFFFPYSRSHLYLGTGADYARSLTSWLPSRRARAAGPALA